MYFGYNISDKTAKLAAHAEADCAPIFKKIEENALLCSAKVLNAFQECRVSTAAFSWRRYTPRFLAVRTPL